VIDSAKNALNTGDIMKIILSFKLLQKQSSKVAWVLGGNGKKVNNINSKLYAVKVTEKLK